MIQCPKSAADNPYVAATSELFSLHFDGFLALMAFVLFINIFSSFPITAQMSVWYSKIEITGLVLLLNFELYAFHTSLGGQPLFGRLSLED